MEMIKSFNFENTEVRTQTNEQGNVLFCASDICTILGYKNSPETIKYHCREAGIAKRYISYPSGAKLATFINEGNLYRLVAKSQLPAAEKFESWVFDEVLPSIRKHGIYATPMTVQNMIDDPDYAIELLQKLKVERAERAALAAQVTELAPKAEFYDVAMSSQEGHLIRDVAKILAERGKAIGEKKLFSLLREKGIFMKDNTPYQDYVNRGYFRLKLGGYTDLKTGEHHTTVTPMVLPKGVDYIHKIMSVPVLQNS